MKTDRDKKILVLIVRYEIGTQEELAKILNDEGYNVTQATVSRDIRELNLSKVSVDGKRTRYATLTKDKPVASDKFLRVLKEGFVSMDMAQNILVIKPAPGMAMAVCAAIDALDWNEIVGCIGGDDTILCVARDDDAALVAAERLKKMVDGMEETGEEI